MEKFALLMITLKYAGDISCLYDPLRVRTFFRSQSHPNFGWLFVRVEMCRKIIFTTIEGKKYMCYNRKKQIFFHTSCKRLVCLNKRETSFDIHFILHFRKFLL